LNRLEETEQSQLEMPMDNSFDAFGTSHGGWGGDSYGDFENVGPKLNTTIPFPATVRDLLEMSARRDEHLIVGKHAFTTVCLVAKVAFVRSEQSAQYMTYGLVDIDDPEGERSQRVVNVSRFMNEDDKMPDVHAGSTAFTVGKLRSFDDQLSVTCFHIRAISNPKEVEVHLSQVKVAKIFYQKDILGRTPEEMTNFKDTVFSLEPPKRRDANANQATILQRAPQQVAQSPMTITQQRMDQISLTKQPISSGVNENHSEGGNGELSGQKGRILEYIRENGEGGSGVSSDQIRRALNPDRQFQDDIQYLLAEALIFTTTDTDVYCAT